MTECNGCGRCCDPVVLPFGPYDLLRMGPGLDPEDRRFVQEDLTLLSRREGLSKADYLSQGGKTSFGFDGTSVILWSYFYECRHFDPETRQCRNFDNRPPLCRGYPWYEDGHDPSKAIPPECSYNVDVGRPVKLLPTRREA